MTTLRKAALPILLATIWIAASEFVRNELLLKSYWSAHYAKLGLVFPSKPVNGALWGLWSFLFAVGIYVISKRFKFMQTAWLSWFLGFVLMWIVIGNLGVLPYALLAYAIPLSLLEAFIGTSIIKKLS
jgi:hypothetical protein